LLSYCPPDCLAEYVISFEDFKRTDNLSLYYETNEPVLVRV
jgi:hypothetical protein